MTPVSVNVTKEWTVAYGTNPDPATYPNDPYDNEVLLTPGSPPVVITDVNPNWYPEGGGSFYVACVELDSDGTPHEKHFVVTGHNLSAHTDWTP